MLRIWGRTNSVNVQKVMWAVGEIGIAHERMDAGLAFGVVETPEYKAKNPNSRVPTVEDDGLVLWESNATVRYLAAKYSAGQLWPADPGERSLADRWMDWATAHVQPDLTPVFWGLIRTPAEQRNMAAIEAAAERSAATWRILDAHLARQPYVGGQQFTMGDIPVGCFCWRYYALPIKRPELANLAAWYARLQARPAFRTHVAMPLT
ncbi:MAG: glutathione S-transferase [Alphaproteobacteria bacterium]|nr:glutathione S-transferase [Alphaproteobacteria bacterium]